MELPSQYKAKLELYILGASRGKAIDRIALPPPCYSSRSSRDSKPSENTCSQPTSHSFQGRCTMVDTSYRGDSTSDNQLCAICKTNPKDMAFGCGHQTCCDCGKDLLLCPICRDQIKTRIKLY